MKSLALALAALSLPVVAFTTNRPAAPTKWEYEIFDVEVNPTESPSAVSQTYSAAKKQMNELGKEGWELVGDVEDISEGPDDSYLSHHRLLFKRPL